jgi:DnaJ-class molecular chaperone
MEVHSDRNRDKPECQERLKEINEAYAALGNAGKRRRYDLLCQQGLLRTGPCSREETDSDFVSVLYGFFHRGLDTPRMGACRRRGSGRRGCRRWNRNA